MSDPGVLHSSDPNDYLFLEEDFFGGDTFPSALPSL